MWAKVAEDLAERSLCVRARVGAVIVDSRNRVVATGYNGPPAGFDHGNQTCDSWCPRARPKWGWDWDPQGGHGVRAPVLETQMTAEGLRDLRTNELVSEDELEARGFVKREQLSPDYSDCVALHAEANAISVCDRSQRDGGAMYVLGTVCYACAKLIANSGLSEVVVLRDKVDRSYRDPAKSYAFLEMCGVTVVEVG